MQPSKHSMSDNDQNNARWHAPWWDDQKHGTAWQRVQDAFKRDWEQTKNDIKAGGRELNQNVGDTVKQATGRERIPSENEPNHHEETYQTWEDVEPLYQFGYSARAQYGAAADEAWNESLEKKLRKDWDDGHSQSKVKTTWDKVKNFVRRGFENPSANR